MQCRLELECIRHYSFCANKLIPACWRNLPSYEMSATITIALGIFIDRFNSLFKTVGPKSTTSIDMKKIKFNLIIGFHIEVRSLRI